MTVRCKMACVFIGSKHYGKGPFEATFRAEADDGEENKPFFAGDLKIAVMKERHFEVGKSYYIDITEAPS